MGEGEPHDVENSFVPPSYDTASCNPEKTPKKTPLPPARPLCTDVEVVGWGGVLVG